MIDIVTLKKEIEENKFDKKLLIAICKDESSRFVINQYLHYYMRKNDLNIDLVDDLEGASGSLSNGLLFEDLDIKVVQVYKIKVLNYVPNYSGNLWIICEKVTDEIRKLYDDNIVKINKLEDWQIKDYVMSTCHISDDQAKILMEAYKDINKLDIEIKKLQIFKESKYDELMTQLIYDEDKPIFDLVNALVKRDKQGLSDFVKSGTRVEPFALIPLLVKNFKCVIDIQLAKNPTAESVGMSGKQFWAVQKYSCGHYNREELMYIYEFLTELDSKIKMGNLDTSFVTDYIVGKFIALM